MMAKWLAKDAIGAADGGAGSGVGGGAGGGASAAAVNYPLLPRALTAHGPCCRCAQASL